MIEPRALRDATGTSLRIPFGTGRRDELAPTCTGCDTPRGTVHARGCPAEPCPRCHHKLVACGCFAEATRAIAGAVGASERAQLDHEQGEPMNDARENHADVGEPR